MSSDDAPPRRRLDALGRSIERLNLPEDIKREIELAYGLLWGVETDDRRVHNARKILLSLLTHFEQRDGIAMANTAREDGRGGFWMVPR